MSDGGSDGYRTLGVCKWWLVIGCKWDDKTYCKPQKGAYT